MEENRVVKARRLPRSGAAEEERAIGSVDRRAADIYAVVRSIPRGKVATYGQIAELAGIPAGHRVVARAMRSCPERLPWQRVIGKKDARRGQINIEDPEHAALQRARLESERVVFDANGFVLLARSGWMPQAIGAPTAAQSPSGRATRRLESEPLERRSRQRASRGARRRPGR
jgi:methylated-DNA-protein-cysteine methyltransferase-like protein